VATVSKEIFLMVGDVRMEGQVSNTKGDKKKCTKRVDSEATARTILTVVMQA
jgi:hypothetical protein